MGVEGTKRAGHRSRTVYEDWLAWLPQEMDQLFDATRNELESSNLILSVALDEALSLCEDRKYSHAVERATVFGELFDRLATHLSTIVRGIKNHGSHFGILPSVTALSASNFRGTAAQKISTMNSLLAKVLFRSRTRFFHKLHSLEEIIDALQGQVHTVVDTICHDSVREPDREWRELEVLAYDLNTCMGEAIIVLKSYFCALPPAELESFRKKLAEQVPAPMRRVHLPTYPLQEK
jgi:hypothetical protein